MRLRASVIVVAVAAVPMAGCGGSAPTPGAQVAAYVTKVNALQRRLQVPLKVVSTTVGGSGLPQAGGAGAVSRQREQALLGAWRQITALRAQLAAVKAPAAAAQLRSLMLQLVDRQADLTLQSARLIAFLPAFTAALKPLAPATVRLEKVLRVTQAPGSAAVAGIYAQKAQALRTYRQLTQRIDSRLLALTPPTILASADRTELAALRGMGTASGQLADALASGQTGGVAQATAAFDRSAAAPGTLSAQRAQAAAVKAYDREIGQVTQLQVAVARERLRLSNALG